MAANPEIENQEVNTRVGVGKLQNIVGWEPRPMRLADIFLAYREWWRQHALKTGYLSAEEKNDEQALDEVMWESDDAESEFKGIAYNWNLRKDSLTEQSDECLRFLAELLGDYKRAVTNQYE